MKTWTCASLFPSTKPLADLFPIIKTSTIASGWPETRDLIASYTGLGRAWNPASSSRQTTASAPLHASSLFASTMSVRISPISWLNTNRPKTTSSITYRESHTNRLPRVLIRKPRSSYTLQTLVSSTTARSFLDSLDRPTIRHFDLSRFWTERLVTRTSRRSASFLNRISTL